MGATRRFGPEERQARLVVRHRLAGAAPAERVEDVARDLLGLHATDAATVFLAAAARLQDPSVAAVEDALYERRSVVRMLGMRRTMFVVPVGLVPIVHGACTATIVVRERRRFVEILEQHGVAGDGAAWLRRVEEETLAALRARGEAMAAELSADVPELKGSVPVAEGKAYEGQLGFVTRVLFLLAADGRIVRGRPRGTWISTQYRWAPAESWLPGGPGEVPPDGARVELARRWLRAFGPAPVTDLRWWTGWTAREANAALAGLETETVDLDGRPGLVLAGDAEPEAAPAPAAALLPALDPTPMGWSERGWFLGPHGPALFDRSGNVGPTVWWGGRIVGGWAQRREGSVAVRLLEDVGAEAAAEIAEEAARLEAWIGPVRVTPRFRTPLERELVT